MDCLFCEIVKGNIPSNTIYEDDLVKVFLDINPNTNGHMLIIPKKHITDFTEISDEELAKRRAEWKAPAPKVSTGYLARYAKLVSSADKGAVLE